MTATGAVLTATSGPDHEARADAIRLKRVGLRSWRRGMRETDLLLGRFADAELRGMPSAELTLYEALLEENDQDIYAWIIAAGTGRDAAPERFRSLISRISAAAAARIG